jgi:hypothetical protein
MSLVGLVFAAAMAHAGPVTMCGTQFQYDCVALTLGGYTVITTLGSTGQTEITGYSQSSSVVFDQVIPIPPTGPEGNDVQEAALHADAKLAIQSGLGGLAHCTKLPQPSDYLLMREELGIVRKDPVFERTLASAAAHVYPTRSRQRTGVRPGHSWLRVTSMAIAT